MPQSLDPSKNHLLIIRFSSLGDIVQGASVPRAFKQTFPESKVDWLVRSDFQNLLTSHPALDRVISFDRKQGFLGLLRFAWSLGQTPYTHIYDAHSNVRSFFVSAILRIRRPQARFVRRSKERINRWLLFRFRIHRLPTPFRGAESFHRPLSKWGIQPAVPSGQQFFPSGNLSESVKSRLALLQRPVVALAPSAAWEMKRWPISHWKKLIELSPMSSFVLLGGPEDHFLEEIAAAAPERTLNLAGKTGFDESASLLKLVDACVANDTGMLHIADQMEVPAIALIGPTAFGYPSHSTSQIAEITLSCKPCSKDGRGRCINSLYQRCLVELTPEKISKMLQTMLLKGAKA